LDWRDSILNRLDIKENQSKLILDKTGILTHENFISYLTEKKIKFSHTKNLQEILTLVNQPGFIIITPYREIPSYLAKKIDTFTFDHNQLPIDIEYPLILSLAPEKLIALIAYRVNCGNFSLLTEANIEQELTASEKYLCRIATGEIEAKLVELCKEAKGYEAKNYKTKGYETKGYNNILDLGGLWGKYVYSCFKSGISPKEELISKVDGIVESHVLHVHGNFRDHFYESLDNFKTVAKIRQYIANQKSPKFALLCFDGMGIAEWELLKDHLREGPLSLSFLERKVFALIPTITKISRSAIYYGDCGDNFQTIYSLKTPNEYKEFCDFFKGRDCSFHREGEIESENNVLGIDCISIIYDVFDKIGHDTKLPPREKTVSFRQTCMKNRSRNAIIGG